MILILLKPFGGDNYVVLDSPEDLQALWENLTPGDEFIMRVIELSDQEFEQLDEFQGFNAGPIEETTTTEPTEKAPPVSPPPPTE